MEKVSKTLKGQLERVSVSVSRMEQYGENVPQIEVDILLSALREMYETAYNLPHSSLLSSGSASDSSKHETSGEVADTKESVPTTSAAEAETPKQESESDGAAVAAAIAAATVLPAADEPSEPAEPQAAMAEIPEEQPLPASDKPQNAEPEPSPAEPLSMEKDEFSILMVDTTAKPVYAEEEEPTPQTVGEPQPTMEDIEGNLNDELFDEQNEQPEEPISDTVEEAPMEKATIEEQPATRFVTPEPLEEEGAKPEQPQTLWDKLQSQQTVQQPFGERINSGKTISDQLAENQSTPVIEEIPVATPKTNEVPLTAPMEPAQPVQQTEHQSSLFDYFKNKSPEEQPVQRTVADNLGMNITNTTEKKASSSKVSDLRTIININDKFSFMNELFRNNMKGYNDFILHLNELTDRAEALNYVEGIATQYNWEKESQTVMTFWNIFDRKF